MDRSNAPWTCKEWRSLVLTLVLLCFFSSMFITNDVALITFVPFTFTGLDSLGEEQKKRLLLPVVVMQTIVVNMGGLGTLIASMASLISYKYVAKEAGGCKGAYILLFTVGNICFLAMLILLNVWNHN